MKTAPVFIHLHVFLLKFSCLHGKKRDAAVFSYFFQDTSIVTSFPEQAFQGKNKYQCILQEKNSLDLKSYCFCFYEHVLYREICS